MKKQADQIVNKIKIYFKDIKKPGYTLAVGFVVVIVLFVAMLSTFKDKNGISSNNNTRIADSSGGQSDSNPNLSSSKGESSIVSSINSSAIVEKETNGNVTILEIKPGSTAESDLIDATSTNTSTLQKHGDYFRLADAANQFTYKFEGKKGQKAYVVLQLAHEFLVEASIDKNTYTAVLDFETTGRFRDERAIDVTSYFADSNVVYLRIRDKNPNDGWGPHIFHVRYVKVDEVGKEGTVYRNENQGWTLNDNMYNAGDEVVLANGKSAAFQKSIVIPDWWKNHNLAISFANIEGKTNSTEIFINGAAAKILARCGNHIVAEIPKLYAGKTVTVTVKTAAGTNNTVGLWKNIRIGFDDMITFPETSWSLGNVTRKLNKNYAPYDVATLNSLAGNFMTTLFNNTYKLNSFDTAARFKPLFYVHDAARSLLAIADEERYSPVVRLDYAMALYQSIVAAKVPTSDFDIFLKKDERPKRVLASSTDAKKFVWTTEQDVVEYFTDMSVEVTSGSGKALGINDLSMQDTSDLVNFNGYFHRIYSKDSTRLDVNIKWYSGFSDKATTATFKASNAKSFNIVFDNFDKQFYARTYTGVSDASGKIIAHPKTTSMDVGSKKYFFLHKDLSWQAGGILFVWDIAPDTIEFTAAKNAFTSIKFVYNNGNVTPTISALNIADFDTNLEYAFFVGDNIAKHWRYGTNGYDPGYICGVEGLGTAAFSSGAYVMKKYGVAGAEAAEELAVHAMTKAVEASKKRNYTPSYLYDRVAACDYLVKLGHVNFKNDAAFWADKILSEQKSDGSFYWFDTRNPNTMARAHLVTGNQKYLSSVQKYKESNVFIDSMVVYKNQIYKELSFLGAGDLSYLSYLGDKNAFAAISKFKASGIDDTGFFDCSDLNPYFLGWSLCNVMNKKYNGADKKTIVKANEYCFYDLDGNITLLDYPTAYINNQDPLQ